MPRGFGKSASGQACQCEEKDKNNWEITGYVKQRTQRIDAPKTYIVCCDKCGAQWNTKAKYCEELRKASWIKTK